MLIFIKDKEKNNNFITVSTLLFYKLQITKKREKKMVVPSVGFDINSKKELARQIISIPDEHLNIIAHAQTADKYEKKNENHQKAGTALMAGIPIVHGISTALNSDKKLVQLAQNQGITTVPMKAAERAVKGLKSAGYLGAELGGFAIANKAYNKLSEKIPFLKKFKEESPTLYTLTGLAATFFGGEAVARGGAKVASKIAETKTVQNLNIPQKIETALNTIKKHIPEKVSNFAKAHSKGIKTASKLVIPAAIVGYFASGIINAVKQENEAQAVYQEAKNLKSQVAVDYAKTLDAEDNI